MARVLIIGAGGVGSVVAHKCVQQKDIFSSVHLASRRVESCERVKASIGGPLEISQLDASSSAAVVKTIQEAGADLVINVALPYQDLPIMDACLETGCDYLDTAVSEKREINSEDPSDEFWYQPQWDYRKRFADRGLTAVLGMGFDPGVVNVFCAHARDALFDRVTRIDILDVNAGKHGYPFATNFDPVINLREVQNPSHYWSKGQWVRVAAHQRSRTFDFPVVGTHRIYSMDHDELHSLCRAMPDIEHLEFWMGFSEQYIQHVNAFRNVGFLSVDPVSVEAHDGQAVKVVPLEFLGKLLPDPGSMAENYEGKICIGALVTGEIDGVQKRKFVYSTLDHVAAFREVGSQAISYSTGVPVVTAAALVAGGAWRKPGVHNAEDLRPGPFLELMPEYGIQWSVMDDAQPLQSVA